MAGLPPSLTDSELVCLAVAQALLGCKSEARWLRFAQAHLAGMFPYLPQRPGYNRRLRAALPLIKRVIRLLAADTDFWLDNVLDCRLHPGGMRPLASHGPALGPGRLGELRLLRLSFPLVLGTAALPDLPPRPGCPSPGRWPIPKIDEREVLAAMLEAEPDLAARRPGLILIADKGFRRQAVRSRPGWRGIELLRPSAHRAATARRAAAQTGAPAHRVGQRHPQRPARPRTPRRPDLRGRRHPRRPAHPGHGRRHLAQPPHRPALRNYSSRSPLKILFVLVDAAAGGSVLQLCRVSGPGCRRGRMCGRRAGS